jgi:CheY-like chemotaxis protein
MTTNQERRSVLIIDDDIELRLFVQTVADLCDVPLLQAGDCDSGLRILDKHHKTIKTILLDYFMPGMSPVNCAGCISKEAGSEISVVLLTAAPDPAERAAELRLKRWLAKPLDAGTLMNLLLKD